MQATDVITEHTKEFYSKLKAMLNAIYILKEHSIAHGGSEWKSWEYEKNLILTKSQGAVTDVINGCRLSFTNETPFVHFALKTYERLE